MLNKLTLFNFTFQLNATDGDSSALTSLKYSLTSGNADNIYRIDEDTGIISVRDTSRGSRSSPHKLKVVVTDGRFKSQA